MLEREQDIKDIHSMTNRFGESAQLLEEVTTLLEPATLSELLAVAYAEAFLLAIVTPFENGDEELFRFTNYNLNLQEKARELLLKQLNVVQAAPQPTPERLYNAEFRGLSRGQEILWRYMQDPLVPFSQRTTRRALERSFSPYLTRREHDAETEFFVRSRFEGIELLYAPVAQGSNTYSFQGIRTVGTQRQ